MNWYEVENPDTIASPALLVYPDRVTANIRSALQIAGMADGKGAERLRPHVKTHKMRAVTELLLAEGIVAFKCATLREARMLANAGARDVLLAYPLVGPSVQRLAELRDQYPAVRFACLIDNETAADRLSASFVASPLDVYIDLNVGMNRTGIKPADAPALYDHCQSQPGIRVVGLHAYDGHIRDTDLTDRARRTDESFTLAAGVQQAIADAGGETLPLIMGGSPSFSMHARRPGLELSPGTFVFWDAGYAQMLPDQPFVMAAVLLMRVISIVDPQTICLDLGHKSVAAENPLPRVVFLNEPGAQPIGQSEEHLVVRVEDSSPYQPGDVWYGVPVHICPTVNLYDQADVVVNNQWTGRWEVTARGH
ncbi:D-TA family PLP-dependent enzyme [Spirosoma sp. 209]|uniref:D-TA family PLP-dependent enzyme n=1 Tax=Spirosoma sp. 209 TaxID=1955701 RepID=UPI00098D749B|nr:D-TA family PLP-dependent enzyme [Spirosoma sp. 209]